MRAPVETKVQLGSVASGLSTVTIAPLVVWGLGVLIWGGSPLAVDVEETLLAVPWVVSGVATGLVASGGAWLGGWLGKHTARPDLDHDQAPVDVVDVPRRL